MAPQKSDLCWDYLCLVLSTTFLKLGCACLKACACCTSVTYGRVRGEPAGAQQNHEACGAGGHQPQQLLSRKLICIVLCRPFCSAFHFLCLEADWLCAGRGDFATCSLSAPPDACAPAAALRASMSQSFCGFCCSQHALFVPYFRKVPWGYVSLVRVRCACCSVIQFKEVFLTPYQLAIVMEFAPGGDMFQFVKASGGLKVRAP